MKENFPELKIELVKDSGGIFDVICDGKVIYSKLRSNEQRFPEVGEISRLIKND